MSKAAPSAKELHEAFKKLHAIGKETKGVYISNGLLVQCEKSEALKSLLSEEETEFLSQSTDEYNRSIAQRRAANREHTNTISSLEKAKADAEKLAAELTTQAIELKKAKEIAEKTTDQARRELREQAQVALEANRQKNQFTIHSTWWMPTIVSISVVLLLGCMYLAAIGKENDNMLLILGTCLGTLYSAFNTSNSSVYTPVAKDESKSKYDKDGSD